MGWTIETDEEAEARQRTGAINGRYQVCHPVDGLIECADRLSEAFAIGDRWDERETGYPKFQVEVYDRMARNGQPRIWRRQSKMTTHCWEHGDRFSRDGRWKVIKRVGVEPIQTDDLTCRVWK